MKLTLKYNVHEEYICLANIDYNIILYHVENFVIIRINTVNIYNKCFCLSDTY